MNFLSLQLAISSLKRNKVRTFLTVLGVVIGITAVIVMMSVGQGLKLMISQQLESFGTNLIQTETRVPTKANQPAESAQAQAMGVAVTTMKNSDIEAVRRIPNIKDAFGGQMTQLQVTYQDKTRNSLAFGVSEGYLNVDSDKVEFGRFIAPEEQKGADQVVVLGPDLAKFLFDGQDPLEKKIKIKNLSFRVIGVLAKRGSASFINMDDRVVIPLKTIQDRIMGLDYVNYITASAIDNTKSDATAEDIRILLRQRHRITDISKDDFQVTTMAEAMSSINTILGAITLLLIAIAGISLVVGGVGVSNIMYVSIKERTYEIGLRKALGATAKYILWQFLWEAVVITVFGGIIGVVLGVIFSVLASLGASLAGYDWPLAISGVAIITSFGLSVLVGLVFGVYPARHAARLSPVDALRYE
ncbi:MAG: ABC transporter permease [Candidatus Buchananbacteria bacterium]